MYARASRRSDRQARKAALFLNQHPTRVAYEEVRLLISAVEDLISRIGAAADPELRRLRTQAETALVAAKGAIAEGGGRIRDQAQGIAEQGDAYVRERPWTFMGVAALLVLAVGVWAGRAISDELIER